jgi:predicted ATPase/signal transduction histidine kinase
VDGRSDLYSLGVLLYLVLTGQHPFVAADLPRWIHCHLTQQPRPPAELGPVPGAVSQLVMKLLAKLPEERYQSAEGLKHDLEECLGRCRAGQLDAPLHLGAQDFRSRFRLPSRFYGRDRELEALVRASQRSAESGEPALVLVEGPAGIGKTTLVEELRRRLADAPVRFGQGKFERHPRGPPYAALGAALDGLFGELLSSSEEDTAHWRAVLLDALGGRGQLVARVVPRLERLIGPQPPVPDLPPADSRIQFERVWQRFLQALAEPGRALVLFLDDLQWADEETLSLVASVSSDPSTRHLLVLGACRDGDLDASHPLHGMVEMLRRRGLAVDTIQLGPFTFDDATSLVADALSCDRARSSELAGWVHARTGGTPFTFLQILSALAEEGLFSFDRADRAWVWDLERIQAWRRGEDAPALVVGRFQQLPPGTRRLLGVAANLGDGSHADALALVSEQAGLAGRAREDAELDLWLAGSRGLVRASAEGSLAFTHERIREVAAELIPAEERPRLHREVGLALLAQRGGQELGDGVFEVIRHLEGAALVLAPEERIRLAELELEAGRRSRSAMAHRSAARHFTAGQQQLPSDAWGSHRGLAWALALERAHVESLLDRRDTAEEWIAVLLREARSSAERAEAYRVRVALLEAGGDTDACARAALDACAQVLGLELPLHPAPAVLEGALSATLEALGARTIEQQLEAPDLTDPDERVLQELVFSAARAVVLFDPMLHDLLICEAVRRIFLHGNGPDSAYLLGCFAVALGQHLGCWSEAFRLSAVSCSLADRRGARRKAGSHFMAGVLARQGGGPGDATRAFRAAWQAAVDGADLDEARRAGCVLVQTLLAAGDPLEDVAEEIGRQRDFARSARSASIDDALAPMDRFVAALRGGTQRLGSFEGPGFDSAASEARLSPADPALPTTYFGYRAFAELLAGCFAAALDASARVRSFARDGDRAPSEHFWIVAGLAASGRHDEVAPAEQGALLDAVRLAREQLRGLAAGNPRTFTAGLALISAEAARLEGRALEAIEGYEAALTAARQDGYPYLEGMAGEAAGRLCSRRSWPIAAVAYLRAASDAFRRWGATAKVQALAAEHPTLQSERAGPPLRAAEGGGAPQLDLLAAAARASQAISGEMNLTRLLETLLRTVMDVAGAQFGALLLDGGPEAPLAARAHLQGADLDVTVTTGSSAGADDLPASVLQYTRSSHGPVVLWDTAEPNPYSGDAMLKRRGARSLACLPILRRGALHGLLYLENDVAPSAFTAEQLPVLELLAAQAAIALELSRHREQLEQLVARRTAELTGANESLKAANRKLELAQGVLLQSEKMASIGRLAAGVAHEINNPVAYVASNLNSLEGYVEELLEVAGVVGPGKETLGEEPGESRCSPKDARLAGLREELASVLGDTHFGLDRVKTIVRALRTMSHVSETSWQVTDIRLGIESTLHLMRSDLERKAVVVVEHGEMPPVECLPSDLNQVFMNLLMNALQALPERGTIAVRSGTASEEAWIEVSDTGVGIAPENLSKIFDPFFTTKPVGEGTGLGLSLAYGVIEKHHGRIEVSSEVGKGTTFRIVLPLRQPVQEPG